MLCSNIGINESGHLTFAGEDTVRLAAHYKTPLYLMDEDRIRENCRIYKTAMERAFGAGSYPLYASKAASFKRMYTIMQEEKMAIDVVSAGEIATAKRAGFSMERAFFHGNNKTDADVSYAMAANVGYFVADHEEELEIISREAKSRGIRQKVLLRLTPGIDPHTYEAVATGKVDSKFGVAIETGQADHFVQHALSLPNLTLPLFLVLLIGALAYLKYGPSEKNNVNANTSGVAALLRTAEQLTPRYRNDVCFLFLDGGSDNMRGAKGFRKRYPSAKEKPVLCLDCVGSGDELLILPGKGARWNGELLDAINSSFENSERKTCYDKVDGLVHFPGDQRAFKQGVAVCAVRRVPGFGRFICPTGKDNRIDDENLELLSRGLVKLAAAYQIKK